MKNEDHELFMLKWEKEVAQNDELRNKVQELQAQLRSIDPNEITENNL